jgi:hypothetical protein
MEKQIKLNPEDAVKILADLRRKKVQTSIEESTEHAVNTTTQLMTSEDVPPVVRLAAAKDILDRAGFKPVDRLAIAQVTPITGMKFVFDNGTDLQN